MLLLLAFQPCVGGERPQSSIAYCRPLHGYWQIWRFEPATREHTPLTSSPWDKRGLRYVPKTGRILFRNNQGKLFETSTNGKEPTPVVLPATEVVKDFDYAANRGFLVSSYAANALDSIRIWFVPGDRSEKRLLVSDPHLNELPRWISGSQDFVYVNSHAATSTIHRASAVTGTHRPLFNINICATDPAPSPDGKRLACCVEGPKGFDLCVVDLKNPAVKVIYAGSGLEADPSWSPDGRVLFFSTWDGHNFRIAAVDRDGSDFRYISPKGIDARFPICLSPTHGGVE